MGLDITFYRKNRNSNIKKEVGYFRKANFLIPFFFEDYYGGFESKKIDNPYNELIDLKKRCEIVLRSKNETISDDILPTASMPFGGSALYDNYYYSKVEKVKKWLDSLLLHWEDGIFTIELIS